jgi:hypothetical protein
MTEERKINAFRKILCRFDEKCPLPDRQLDELKDIMFDKKIDMHIEAEESHKRTVVMLAVVRNFSLRHGLYNLADFLAFFDSDEGTASYAVINDLIDKICAGALVGVEKIKRSDQLNFNMREKIEHLAEWLNMPAVWYEWEKDGEMFGVSCSRLAVILVALIIYVIL